MVPATTIPESSKAARRAGNILRGLCALFLLLDGVMKIARPAQVVEAFIRLGFPESTVVPIGIVLLSCVMLYLVPRTRLLGAILLTGYLGGAVATNVHAGSPLFTNILFPVYLGILLWAGEFLADAQLRALVPVRRP
jgi:hypothetical protein